VSYVAEEIGLPKEERETPNGVKRERGDIEILSSSASLALPTKTGWRKENRNSSPQKRRNGGGIRMERSIRGGGKHARTYRVKRRK